MSSSNFIQYLSEKVNKEFLELVQNFQKSIFSGCGNISSKAFLISDYFKTLKNKTLIWVVNDSTEKEIHKKHLEFFTNIPIFDFEIKENSTQRQKTITLTTLISKILEEKNQIIITTYQNLLTTTPSYEQFLENNFSIHKNQKISLVELFEKLINLNFLIAKNPFVEPGEYYCKGNILTFFPFNSDHPISVTVDFDEISEIKLIDKESKQEILELDTFKVLPLLKSSENTSLKDFFNKNTILLEDELEVIEEHYSQFEDFVSDLKNQHIVLNTFNEDEINHRNLYYLSVTNFHTLHDFITEIKEKKQENWKILICTKHLTEIKNIFDEKKIIYSEKSLQSGVFLKEINKETPLPQSFQNPHIKTILITDKNITHLNGKEKKQTNTQSVYLDLLTTLKYSDLVVHADHGVGRFLGLEKKTVTNITKEYLKLGYAENDKLFVPIDQADKVSKYIGAEELAPKLTRLGSAEWVTINKKIKAETQKIAKELLKMFAIRKSSQGIKFKKDTPEQDIFENSFPYEPTPGQIKAIIDVKNDMEKETPMDRLVCGDVGFGKTEVAMRAAFKAVKSGHQVAFISPITILTDQHFQSFNKRMQDFNIRIEMISRFRTKSQQKEILEKLQKGEIDIIIGTHRLIQPDVKFKKLGLIIIDEEQRFGVQQKEKLKELRSEVDVLTLTATPIPRTLNICLNKLRDITTITTPPPGRLPIITEVRKYSEILIQEAITRELARGGQVYFLHNKVQTIDSVAHKLKTLIPEANFVVAHGQLSPAELEKRIIDFKNKKFDVLVSSTIIENGIDLSNANTLIVNNAEKFGLSQLYQLRGRVGRGKQQAYSYFLYHGQRLKLDAKKRLRAIVEASELGSGFQIAMKDLEIRGAGEILGANQAGAMQVVGVSHFIRMLNKTIEEMQSGKKDEHDEIQEVSIELPINAYIPDSFIPSAKEKINFYQKLSSADNLKYLKEIQENLEEEYGKTPIEVLNLFYTIELKIYSKQAKLLNIKSENSNLSKLNKVIVLTMSDQVKPENIFNLLNYNSNWQISTNKLKINLENLGAHWFPELTASVKALSAPLP